MKQRRPKRKDPVQLPEDVILQILAKLPYPEIFKTKFLSKRLASFFSSNPHELDSKAFREEVGVQASQWSTFNPLLVWKESNRMVGFDMSRKVWQEIRVPSLGVCGGVSWREEWTECRGWTPPSWIFAAGSLLCWFESRVFSEIVPTNGILTEKTYQKIVVMNAVTGAFKVLNSPKMVNTYDCPRRSPRNKEPPTRMAPRTCHSLDSSARFFQVVQDGFLILLMYEKLEPGPVYHRVLLVYDSRRASWRTYRIGELEHRELVHAKLGEDNTLYLLTQRDQMMISYNFADGTMTEVDWGDLFRMEFADITPLDIRLVTCGSRVFLLCFCRSRGEVVTHKLMLIEYSETEGVFVHAECKQEITILSQCQSDLHHIYVNRYYFASMVDYQNHLRPYKLDIFSYSLETEAWTMESLPMGVLKGFQWVENPYTPGRNPFFYPQS